TLATCSPSARIWRACRPSALAADSHRSGCPSDFSCWAAPSRNAPCCASPRRTNGIPGGGRKCLQFMSEPLWAALDDERLLDVRLCDLGLTIEGTEIEQRITQVNSELDARGLAKPHYWLSNEWFTPDGVPGIAIPFYLAHPRLAKLELTQML